MENKERPLVLVIAGVDSGGGAGITADCLTIHDHNAFALPLVSAVTSQSLIQVTGCEAISVDLFNKSLDLAKNDWSSKISAIKVGLVTHKDILDILIKRLKEDFTDVPVVWDPVLTATAGRLDSADLKKNLDKILPLVNVFTPNLPEALELASFTKEKLKKEGMQKLAKFFLDKGAKNVIIKGGHIDDAKDAIDYFANKDLSFTLSHKKVDGDGAHGGGCALSSALAALIANGYAAFDAACLAKAYVYNGIVNPALPYNKHRPPIGHHGMVHDIKLLPIIREDGFPTSDTPFAPCPHNLGLYPVVDSVEWIETLLAIGVKTIQLRIKDKDDKYLFEKIQRAVFLGKSYGARIFIDDHYELAIKANAYGVHLGMEDLKEADIQKIKDANLRLGVSTHGVFEMCKALELKPSYIALGHIFPTKSKDMPSKPQGLDKLKLQGDMLKDIIPTVAIGGIKIDKALDVMNCSVGSIAVITAITEAKEPLSETQKWLALVGAGPRHNI